MRAMMIGLAMLLGALTATPAAAQSGELGWLLGKWCARAKEQSLTVCLDFRAQADGSVLAEWSSEKPSGTERSTAVLRIVDGRVMLHSDDQDSDYAEISRAPGEMVLENKRTDLTEGELKQVHYRLSDGDLLVHFDFVGESDGTVRYKRQD